MGSQITVYDFETLTNNLQENVHIKMILKRTAGYPELKIRDQLLAYKVQLIACKYLKETYSILIFLFT